MLDDSEKNVCDQAIQIILKIRKAAPFKENSKGPHIRQFVICPIDCKATAYHKTSTLSATTMSEPPAIRDKFTLASKALAENKFFLMHRCHNQAVERCVKLVTEAAATIQRFS